MSPNSSLPVDYKFLSMPILTSYWWIDWMFEPSRMQLVMELAISLGKTKLIQKLRITAFDASPQLGPTTAILVQYANGMPQARRRYLLMSSTSVRGAYAIKPRRIGV